MGNSGFDAVRWADGEVDLNAFRDKIHMVVGDANDSFSHAILDFLKRHHSMRGRET